MNKRLKAAQKMRSAMDAAGEVLGPDVDVIPEWEQPESTNGYKMVDKVNHNGRTWECTGTDSGGNNIWEPGEYGWTEI